MEEGYVENALDQPTQTRLYPFILRISLKGTGPGLRMLRSTILR